MARGRHPLQYLEGMTKKITLGVVLARKNLDVKLMARTQQEASDLQSTGYRSGTISGVLFPDKLSISHSLSDVFSGAMCPTLLFLFCWRWWAAWECRKVI